MLSSLAYVPLENVIDSFNDLTDQVAFPAEAQPFIVAIVVVHHDILLRYGIAITVLSMGCRKQIIRLKDGIELSLKSLALRIP